MMLGITPTMILSDVLVPDPNFVDQRNIVMIKSRWMISDDDSLCRNSNITGEYQSIL